MTHTASIAKSGQESGQAVSKTNQLTGVRRWEKKVFHPSWTRDGVRELASNYSARISHAGIRRTVNLQTSDLREAARRANRFEVLLKAKGWNEALSDLSPELARIVEVRNSPTVGAYIAAARKIAVNVAPRTLRQYEACLRNIVSMVIEAEDDPKRFDAHKGGAKAWQDRIDATELAKITPKTVEAALVRYIAKRGASPEAKRTAGSVLRQAKGLWSEQIRKLHPIEHPSPFLGVSVPQAKAPRYMPTFDSQELAGLARDELKGSDPWVWCAFLLCLACGMRKAEVDRLRWQDIDMEAGIVRILEGKSSESVGEIPIGPGTVTELRSLKANAAGTDFVIPGSKELPKNDGVMRYRAEPVFARLTAWLRAHGVKDRKPLHALRKEAGSLVNATDGIHAASRFLRHADLQVTAAHYLDGRRRVVVGIFEGKEVEK